METRFRRVSPIPARIRPGHGHSLRAKVRGLPIGVIRNPPSDPPKEGSEGGAVSGVSRVVGQATGPILRRVAN